MGEIMDSMLVDKFQSSDDWALQRYRPNLSGPSVPAIVGVFAVCVAMVLARRRARESFYEAVEGSSPLTAVALIIALIILGKRKYINSSRHTVKIDVSRYQHK